MSPPHLQEVPDDVLPMSAARNLALPYTRRTSAEGAFTAEDAERVGKEAGAELKARCPPGVFDWMKAE